MKRYFSAGTVALFCLVVLLSAGCASKKNVSEPQGPQSIQVSDETPWKSPEEPAPAVVVENDMAMEEQQLAMQKQQAVKEMGNVIYFTFDSFELTKDARALLQGKAEIMKRYPAMTIVVEGYCDERGTVEYNLALGERRARAAYEFLVLLGIAPDRIRLVSYGEERPSDEGHNEAAWAKNRRDEFRLTF
ncbi:MAG: peptidoglycan-associated lipoprotein Pal [Desulfovibrio sp.]